MQSEDKRYIQGFNHGYLLTKHLPDLVVKLITSIREIKNDYTVGFFSGKEEYELEVSKTYLTELQQLRGKSKDHGLELENEG